MAQADDLTELLKTSGPHEIISLHPGQFLFIENDEGDAMYVVKSGTLRVGRGDIIYETLRPGSIVGEMAIIDERRRSASVIASSHAELFKIDEAEFLSLIANSPRFALAVMRVMSRRLRIMNDRSRPKSAAPASPSKLPT